MIKSMTGFGRAQLQGENNNILVEIKSVNHRYLELNINTPKAYSFLKDKIRNVAKEYISRGKVEINVYINSISTPDTRVSVNHPLASSIKNAYDELAATYNLSNNIGTVELASFSDVLTIVPAETDEDELWTEVEPVLLSSIEKFVSMREIEGQKLKEDVLSRLNTIENYVGIIEELSPQSVETYQSRLYEKLKTILQDKEIDTQRILQEAAIFADKVAVDEETVRLRSHIAQMRQFMLAEDPIGKKCDFLVQEMNRETNTIGSKCSMIDISKAVIEVKAEIEKIREQIQNIE